MPDRNGEEKGRRKEGQKEIWRGSAILPDAEAIGSACEQGDGSDRLQPAPV